MTDKQLSPQEMDEEVVPPGGVGARHVDQAFMIMPIKQTLESAEANGRTVLAWLLRRYIRDIEGHWRQREARIIADQRARGLYPPPEPDQPDEPVETDEQTDQQGKE